MKKTQNPLKDLLNVAMLNHMDNQYFILIMNPNLKPVKLIIDSIVDQNGGKEKFKFNKKIDDSWLHTYQGNNFTIGYLEKFKAIRINFT